MFSEALLNRLRHRVLHPLTRGRPSARDGRSGIAALGHRAYIGGQWEEIGNLQFEFMRSRGLRSDHVFLDIACGSLRGGVHFIRYLDSGNYLGIDREKSLIRAGLSKELPSGVQEEKRPEFVVSGSFEFDRFSKKPDFSLAQSLFTHLIPAHIELCLANLHGFVTPPHEFYATFHPGESKHNSAESHALQRFSYSPEELAAIGQRTGWSGTYLGEWGHPRQVMMQFVAR